MGQRSSRIKISSTMSGASSSASPGFARHSINRMAASEHRARTEHLRRPSVVDRGAETEVSTRTVPVNTRPVPWQKVGANSLDFHVSIPSLLFAVVSMLIAHIRLYDEDMV